MLQFSDFHQHWHTLSAPRLRPTIEIPSKLLSCKAYLRHSKMALRNQCSTLRYMSRPRRLHFSATPSHCSGIKAGLRRQRVGSGRPWWLQLRTLEGNYQQLREAGEKRPRRCSYCGRRNEHNARPRKTLHSSRLTANSSPRAPLIMPVALHILQLRPLSYHLS